MQLFMIALKLRTTHLHDILLFLLW